MKVYTTWWKEIRTETDDQTEPTMKLKTETIRSAEKHKLSCATSKPEMQPFIIICVLINFLSTWFLKNIFTINSFG